jgi:hypothetical protein
MGTKIRGLKVGDAMWRRRVDLLTWRASGYQRDINRLLKSTDPTDEDFEKYDRAQLALEMVQDELDQIYLQLKGGDMLDTDIAGCLRDNFDIDKVAVKGID